MTDKLASEMHMITGLLIVLLALLADNAWVSWRVTRDDGFSPTQMKAQLVFIWLLPLAGAMLVHWISVAQSRQRDDPSRRYASYEDCQGHDKSPNMYDGP